MRYTLLGRTGVRVSELALGTMTFGDDWGLAKETRARLLDVYADAGGNLLDTANEYGAGSAEETLGELLRGRRDAFVLTTKYTMRTRPGDPNSAGNHRKNLVESLNASLRRLGTDYLDMLWVHARDTLTPVPEVMRALDDQVRAGKVLYVGVSDWPAWEVAQANTLADLRGWSPFAGLQIRYNLLERTPERELLPMAYAYDLPVLAWGPLADGRLTGKYLRGESGRLDTVPWGQPRGPGDEVVQRVVAIAKARGDTPARIALAWLRSRPGTVIPLLGATGESQLRDSLGCVDVTLTAEERADLDAVSRIEPGFPHDFLRFEAMTTLIYGDRWRDIDDRRGGAHRAVADDMYQD